MSKTGTKEWAPKSANCCVGCSNNCLYCYAAEMAARFKRRAREDWFREEIRSDLVSARAPRHRGRVMFPTTHDITPGNREACEYTLAGLLAAGNDVLIVTKGGADVVNSVGYVMHDVAHHLLETLYTPKIEMRFSITCLSDAVRSFWEPGAPSILERMRGLGRALSWEPGAPSILERMEGLHVAACGGIPTSVSAEPLLEPERGVELVERLAKLTRGEIWLGRARQLRRRTAWARGRVPGIEKAVEDLERRQSPDRWAKLRERLAGHPQVRWKDAEEGA